MAEGCQSGLMGRPGKSVYQKWYHEFKSRPLRHTREKANMPQGIASSNLAVSALTGRKCVKELGIMKELEELWKNWKGRIEEELGEEELGISPLKT